MNREYLRDRADMTGSAGSVWLAGRERPVRAPVRADLDVDVAVVGGGLAGMLAAYRFADDGARVALIEGRRIGSDTTGHTSAKLTAQHGLMSREIPEGARIAWLQANSDAVERVAAIAGRFGAADACQSADSYLYTTEPEGVDELRRELALYRDGGKGGAVLEPGALAEGIAGAVVLPDQALIDPVALIDSMVDAAGDGLYLFEDTVVRAVDEEGDGVMLSCDGGKVSAEIAIIATHVPFFDTLAYSTRLFQYRHYALEIVTSEPVPAGMWYSEDPPSVSWRPYSADEGHRLVVSGVSHKAGQGGDERERYRELLAACEARFGEFETVRWWSAQDAVTPDGLPLIGKMVGRKRCWMTTGFNAWGMSTSEVSAELLHTLIGGADHALAEHVSPGRVGSAGFVTLAVENADFMKKALSEELVEHGNPEDVGPGEGRAMRSEAGHVAVAREQDGELHVLNAHCTHMRCGVEYNDAENTWDCPCHGSRFMADGSFLHGPARRALEVAEKSER